MNVCGYTRVSGKGQVEGDGPERQQEAITKFCAAHNLPTPLLFFEAGVSGTVDGMDRPKFAEMIESKPDCIVVERLDRLARDLMVSEFLLAECRKRNIPVYSTDQNDLRDMASDGGDPTRVLLRQILGALAQWEKSALVLKLRKARDRKRAETGRCEGARPYGHISVEAPIKAQMISWRESGRSFPHIAEILNYHGYRRRNGKGWTKSAVYQVIMGGK